jgi:membrane-associated phospholipid phosphatase
MYSINYEWFVYLHGLAPQYPELWHFLGGWFGVVLLVAALLFVGLHRHGYKSIFKEMAQHIKEWRALIFLPLATWATTAFLKFLFSHPRPYEAFDLNPISMPGSMDSFPSGHAAFYMALALAVYKYHKKAGWVFIILAGVLSIARIIMGVHYPLDIIAGWFTAIVIYEITKSLK